MKNFNKGSIAKVISIIVAVAVISACMAAGTLAALSADYVWSTEDIKAGSFDHSGGSYTFNLFGEREYVYPADTGSCKLSGPNFQDNIVAWSFEETNADFIPMVYYVLDAEGEPEGIYSAYDFSALAGLDVMLGSKTASVSDISNAAATSISSKLGVGETVYWAWPYDFYEDGAAADNADVETYRDYCAELCLTRYAFNPAIAAQLNIESKRPVGYLIAGEGQAPIAEWIAGSKLFSLDNGTLKCDGQVLTLFNSSDMDIAVAGKITSENFYCVLASDTTAPNIISALSAVGVNAVNGGVAEDFNGRTIIKIYPNAISERASASVVIKATVTPKA